MLVRSALCGDSHVNFGMLLWAVVMYAAFVGFSFGPPPPSDKAMAVMGLVSYLAFAGIAYWLERKRE